ncbi:hypothetical protein V6N13_117094 [Hibiscus sabdariffa]
MTPKKEIEMLTRLDKGDDSSDERTPKQAAAQGETEVFLTELSQMTAKQDDGVGVVHTRWSKMGSKKGRWASNDGSQN